MNKLISAAAIFAALTGCGGGATPDLYNFVVDSAVAGPSCYRSMMGSNTTTTGVLGSGQFSVWDGPEGKAFLQLEGAASTIDMGDAPSVPVGGIIEGTYGTGGWNFVNERITTTSQGGATPTFTERTKLSLVFYRGGTFKGALSASSSRTCAGTGCPPDFGSQNPSCSIDNVTLRGTRIAVDYERSP